MKTILQIAREIGVSKQAVYKRYRGKLHKELLTHIHMEDNTTYISEQGEFIIKMDFLKDTGISDITNTDTYTRIHTGIHTDTNTEHKPDISSDTVVDTVVDTLIQMLQHELEIKNKQIEELTATIKIQAESINAAHHNELAETIIDGRTNDVHELTPSDEKKVGFFSRFFKRGK